MTNYELDYYLIQSDDNFAAPMLVGDYEVDPECIDFILKRKLTEDLKTRYLAFAPPIPRKPAMVDYLYLECREVYSQKIYDVFKNKEIKGLQWVPAIVTDTKGNEHKGYWIANIYQKYSFFDPEKSERGSSASWSLIKKIFLDEKKVLEIPLEERLVFLAKENRSYGLYHKSIVDLIMSVNPEGLKFVSLEDWRG